ncbi:MAG: D-alanyl-D-alanine carboxypeptidase, partial [Bacteroidota bacterium]
TGAACLQLGESYRFERTVYLKGLIDEGHFYGQVIIDTEGDPSFGSELVRRKDHPREFMDRLTQAMQSKGIHTWTGNVALIGRQEQWLSGATSWEDAGNYYAGDAQQFNYKLNSYEIQLNSPEGIGEKVTVKNLPTYFNDYKVICEVTTHSSSSDQAYIYHIPGTQTIYIRGQIPNGRGTFKIKGSMSHPQKAFYSDLKSYMSNSPIVWEEGELIEITLDDLAAATSKATVLHEEFSATFGEMTKVTLKKSHNLMANALLLSLSQQTDYTSSVDALKKVWKENGLDLNLSNIEDGSGLSRANAVSAYTLSKAVQILKGKKVVSVFSGFKSLKNATGVKYKSGYVSGVRCYVGTVQTKTNGELFFCVMVNNHSTRSSSVRKELFSFLEAISQS